MNSSKRIVSRSPSRCCDNAEMSLQVLVLEDAVKAEELEGKLAIKDIAEILAETGGTE